MNRAAVALTLVVVLVAGCAGGDQSESTVDEVATTPTAAPEVSTVATTSAPELLPGVVSAGAIEVDVPELWRTVGSPPEGAGAAIYAPSDNNMVAERVLLTAVPLDAAATDASLVERAINELEDHFVAVAALGTARIQVGTDARPAQQVRFTWEQPREAGVGWRWVIPAETELIYVTFLADISEPQLYLGLVEELLATARIDG
jgi:hypothetical protein